MIIKAAIPSFPHFGCDHFPFLRTRDSFMTLVPLKKQTKKKVDIKKQGMFDKVKIKLIIFE